MIHYLLQASSSHPALLARCVPPGLLTPAEQLFFEGLKSEQRRQDWLLGRWTGKCLVQTVIGHGLPLKSVEILPAEDGAPEVKIHEPAFCVQSGMSGDKVAHMRYHSLTLSISHSGDWGFCGVMEEARVPFGVDIERIEERREAFMQDYFVRDELAFIETIPRVKRASIATAIWSAKEAALKAIRVGLLTDTRAVKCLPQGDGEDWSLVSIAWDQLKLKKPVPRLVGWWRVWKDFVLTIAYPD